MKCGAAGTIWSGGSFSIHHGLRPADNLTTPQSRLAHDSLTICDSPELSPPTQTIPEEIAQSRYSEQESFARVLQPAMAGPSAGFDIGFQVPSVFAMSKAGGDGSGTANGQLNVATEKGGGKGSANGGSGLGNQAFNVNQGLRVLLQVPSHTLQWLRELYNMYASGNYANHPFYDPDTLLGKITTAPVPDSLKDVSNSANRDSLNTAGNTLGSVNTGLKLFIYLSTLWTHWKARPDIASEPDRIHRTLLKTKNWGEMGYAFFMSIEKTLRPFITYNVSTGQYGQAALMQGIGLFSSCLAWAAVLPGGIAMLLDEAYKAFILKDPDNGFNIANIQNGLQRFSGFVAREGIQLLQIAGAITLYYHMKDPAAAREFAKHIPFVDMEAYLRESEQHLQQLNLNNVDNESLYYWISGSFYIPKSWSRMFGLVAVIAPIMGAALATGRTGWNAIKRALLFRKKDRMDEIDYTQQAKCLRHNMTVSTMAIAGNTSFAGAAWMSAFPVYAPYSYLMLAIGSLFMGGQYFYDHPGSFTGIGKGIKGWFKKKWSKWRGKAASFMLALPPM